MALRIFRTILGLLFIPAAIGFGEAFYTNISAISLFNGSLHIIERGVLAYLLIHVFVFRPVYIYVLGHELVHVVATWICAGSVVSFNVTPSGGNVVTSKTNFFIELSPYFIPLYTLILGLIYWMLQSWGYAGAKSAAIFLFLVGFTLAFHFVMTFEALRLQQADVARSGMVFSFIIIFISNLVIVAALFSPVFAKVSFSGFFMDAVHNSGDLYKEVWGSISDFARIHKFW
jgi:hypothetical protein